ncbi:MAG: class I SAM-dependent methyltransferase [Gammaproteobacteria bacterium]|nr:class I SAM-dependent methyltransferase [Gammaproteobacteria bacterium]
MADEAKAPAADLWSQWLLHGRYAQDAEFQKAVHALVDRYVERVLDGAQLAAGRILVDVGTGEGLVAFRAIERVGASLRVWLTDISEPMLHHAETQSAERGVRSQCTFVRCPADHLDGIPDSSADVVVTRSVLAYVLDKTAALREFHRVLKPGGRISLAEPVYQDDALAASAMRSVIQSNPPDRVSPMTVLLHRWKAAQYPDTEERILASPIANYSERDMIRFAQAAGFTELHLELHIDTLPSIVRSWDVFINSSPHPLAPPLSTIMSQQFTAEERQLFERTMRPVIEDPKAVTTDRMLYLTAKKPFG